MFIQLVYCMGSSLYLFMNTKLIEICYRQLQRLLHLEAMTTSMKDSVLAYHDKIATTEIYIRNCSSVPVIGVILLCGNLTIARSRKMMVIGEWIKVKLANELQGILYKAIHRLITEFISIKLNSPGYDTDSMQNSLINIVKELLI